MKMVPASESSAIIPTSQTRTHGFCLSLRRRRWAHQAALAVAIANNASEMHSRIFREDGKSISETVIGSGFAFLNSAAVSGGLV